MVSLATYEKQSGALVLQFRLIRFAVGKLSENTIRCWLRDLHHRTCKKTFSDNASSLEEFRALLGEGWAEDLRRRIERDIRQIIKPHGVRGYREGINLALNQSELLLLVAYFEEFLKEALRSLIEAHPKKAFVRKKLRKPGEQKPTATLEEIFSTGFHDFFKGLVEKEVRQFDRETMDYRTRYLRELLGVPLTEPHVEALEALSAKRNWISHNIAVSSATKPSDGGGSAVVTDETVSEARSTFREVARLVWERLEEMRKPQTARPATQGP
jgi:hypothetical protein